MAENGQLDFLSNINQVLLTGSNVKIAFSLKFRSPIMLEHQIIDKHFRYQHIFKEMSSPLIGFSIDIGKSGEVVGDGRDGGDAEVP